MPPITVIIVDDHPLLRKGLRQILDLESDIEVVGEASDGAEAVAKVQELRPDVVIMDINMPIMNGLEATKEIQTVVPETKVVALTIHDERDYILEILRSGAKSYLLKDSEPGKIAEAVRNVAAGQAYLSGQLLDLVLEDYRQSASQSKAPAAPDEVKEPAATAPNVEDKRLSSLSERELEILTWIAGGKSNREIASGLFISEKTVKNHVSNVLRKLDLADRTQAAVYAIRHGIEPLQPTEP